MAKYKYTYQDWVDGRWLEYSNVYELYLKKLMSKEDYQKIVLEQSKSYAKVLYNAFETLKNEFKNYYNASLLKSGYLNIAINDWLEKKNDLERDYGNIAYRAAYSHLDGRYELTKQQVDEFNVSQIGDSQMESISFDLMIGTYTMPDLYYLIAANFYNWLLWYKEQESIFNTEPVLIFSESDTYAASLRDAERAARQDKEQVSYNWLGKPDELPKLHQLLLNKKLIHLDTTEEQFKAVFSAKPLPTIERIKWNKENNLLAYFIDRIQHKGNIAEPNLWSLAERCFTKSKDLVQARNNYETYNKSKKPKNFKMIDDILNALQ